MSSAPLQWLELRVRSRGAEDREPLLSEALVALGGRAVWERDGWYLTYLPEPADEKAFLAEARERLAESTGLTDLQLASRVQDQEDWAEIWKRGLGPRRIGDKLLVTPSWDDPRPRPVDLVIVIDPGMAFGTAEHGTTRGCLRLLEHVPVEGSKVLDVGAGSGILSIAAAKLGAAGVVALEGDPLAFEALEENVARNGVDERVTLRLEWCDPVSLGALGPVDGVVSNIEAGVLSDLLPGFASVLGSGGWLILSGVTTSEWPTLQVTVEGAGFRLVEQDEDGDWHSGRFIREPR